MAVAKSAASAGVATTTCSSANHTVNAAQTLTVGASDTFLVMLVELDSTTPGTGVAHWDSAGTNQAMTLLGTIVTQATTTAKALALFGLVSPTPGNKAATHSFSGQASAVNGYVSFISFTGTETSSVAAAIEGYATNSNSTGTTASVVSGVAIPSGDMAVSFYGNIPGFSNAFTPGGNPGDGGTAIGKNETLTTNAAAEYYSGAGATITASTGNNSSAAWLAAIVGIKVPAGGATVWQGNATLLVSATALATANLIEQAAATLAAIAGVNVTGNLIERAQATLPATSSLAATGNLIEQASATLAAVSNLNPVLVSIRTTGAATLNATSTLAATGSITTTGAALLAANASLAATGNLIEQAFATLPIGTSLSATASLTTTGAALLSATTSLSASATQFMIAQALLAGVVNLSVDATIPGQHTVWQAAALLAVDGGLAAAATQIMQGQATLAVSGALLAAASQGMQSGSRLDISAALLINAFIPGAATNVDWLVRARRRGTR